MDDTAVTIILSLLGFIETVFIFILAHIFRIQNTLFSKMDTNKQDCRDLIDKNSEQDKANKEDLEQKMRDLLDKHYVTTGQLSTLEERLMGKIDGLTSAINSLTKIIENKL